jgi:hypothetical protein
MPEIVDPRIRILNRLRSQRLQLNKEFPYDYEDLIANPEKINI